MAEHGFKAVDEPSYDLVSVKKDEGFVATATTPPAAGAEPDPDHRLPCGVRDPRRHRQRD